MAERHPVIISLLKASPKKYSKSRVKHRRAIKHTKKPAARLALHKKIKHHRVVKQYHHVARHAVKHIHVMKHKKKQKLVMHLPVPR